MKWPHKSQRLKRKEPKTPSWGLERTALNGDVSGTGSGCLHKHSLTAGMSDVWT